MITHGFSEQNDLNAEWVRSQEQEAGESISFF